MSFASPLSRAWREVSLDAITHNAIVLRSALRPGCRLMAVLKADAYGHGAAGVAARLEREGFSDFAVASLDEGAQLRESGVRGRILILGRTPESECASLRHWRLEQTVVDFEHAQALSASGVPLRVQLALDTGMHRLGIPAENTDAAALVFAMPGLDVCGVFSHLCVSDDISSEAQAYTARQLELYRSALANLRRAGLRCGDTHIQASYGILNLPPLEFSVARAGIALYGVLSDGAPVLRPLPLERALSLRARIASVRMITPGEGAGYGLAFRAVGEKRRIAVLSIGYADGLPREISQQGGEVLIAGRRCPMVGRMCMDQLLVDVTGAPEAVQGGVATLIGRDGGESITAEEIAGLCGTITNELLSRLGQRLPIVHSHVDRTGMP
jgi:alanine racemase